MSSKTKLTSLFVVLFIVMGTLSVICAKSIGEAELPEAVSLPLGEINRSQTERPMYRSMHTVGNIPLSSIPQDAWCGQANMVIENLSLQCYWTAHPSEIVLQADVFIDLPRTGDVTFWKFERESLQAVPQSHSWLVLNLGYILGALVFSIFSGLSLLAVFKLPGFLREFSLQ